MEVEIKPDPTPEERAAILAALEGTVESGAPADRSAWREQGVRENVDDDGIDLDE